MAKSKKTTNQQLNDLTALRNALAKQYQVGGNDEETFTVIPTGSLSLDLATGIGGFPLGRIVETFAEESAGKSFIAQKVCANALKMGLKVAYLDVEHAIDPSWAKFNGFDIYDKDNVLFFQPDTVEDTCNIINEIVDSNMVSVIVIDSLSLLVPEKELEGEVGDATIGVKARLLNQFLRKIKGKLARTNTLLLTIGQLRDTIGGGGYGDTSTTDYGNGVKFAASMRIKYWKGIEKVNDIAVANKTTAKLLKNKCSPPFGTAKFEIVFGEGIDNDKELVLIAVEAGVIEKSGSWYKYKGESLGQGTSSVKEAFLENPEFRIEIIKEVNAAREKSGQPGRLSLPT